MMQTSHGYSVALVRVGVLTVVTVNLNLNDD